jgi:polar amino acid transport system substrate-binding protein
MNLQSTTPRRLALGLVIGAASISLAACGGSSSSGGSSGSASASTSALPSVSADAALAAKVPEQIKSSGKLTFGTDASYPPNEFVADDGSTVVGMDVDLGNAIAAKLGLQGEWTNASFDSLIVGVTNGKFDSSMSSFTINPERLKQVNMVSYFNAGTEWAVASGNPQNINPDDACGKTVGVQKATVQADDIAARSEVCTKAGKPAINVQQYNLQSDVTTALVSGKVDAMLADSPVTEYAIKQTNGKLQAAGSIYASAPYGVAIPKSETAFAETVQAAIQSLIADGSYQQILDKWGVGAGAIKTSELNPTVTS